ncbi:uncharacterized protein LOC130548067 [Triplophysa rosa]|uniref:Ig-like domain-containing protein n=1 Tax=Triplophysa rosa TaxID=992332 RepID=A0A9W7W8Y7_TRIRA|nr:uncharacterized protein LOC130548067 [Triplophysa rosa]KAI7791852.1 hypothetical protein IRJ41_010702 [Triplophysa rosa]
MTEKSDICLLALILLSSLFTGVSGAEVTRVFISSGESVSLPCNDALHQCSSTTWIYNNYTSSSAVEVFFGGINKNNTERSERLSLTSECSLNIYNTTQHDRGVYTCRQYVNGLHHGPESQVYLHVLHVSSSSSSSSSQTEIRANTSVTLSCQLWSHDCDYLLRVDGFQLVWMNQADVDLQTDSRYQIRSDEHDCLISLTTTLVNEDNNTELRCVLKHKNDIKTSVTHTVRFTDSNKILVTTTNPEKTSTSNRSESVNCSEIAVSFIRVILVIVEVSVFAAPTVILLQIICARRAENRRRTQNAHAEDTVMSAVLE